MVEAEKQMGLVGASCRVTPNYIASIKSCKIEAAVRPAAIVFKPATTRRSEICNSERNSKI